VRERGSKTSLGKDSTSNFSIVKLSRHVLTSNVSLREAISFKLERDMRFMFDGKPPSGNISICGQSIISNSVRDGSRICMRFGNNFKFSASRIEIICSHGADNPSLGNDSN
ncbi:hypothetical protein V8G54_013491, partial [Vigna mungo]